MTQHSLQQAQQSNWRWSVAIVLAAVVAATAGWAALRPKNARDDATSSTGLYLVVGAPDKPTGTQIATFAAGCFWGVEDHFRKMKGVVATAVGYTGGHVKKPTYKEVCNDSTGHAEALQLEFDPKVVSYQALVDEFLWIHDPTTLNRQGPDVGSQYRSAIFFQDTKQKAIAEASVKKLGASGELDRPIVTQVVAASTFWPAEGYHQQYVEKGGYASCHPRRKKP